MKRIKKLLAVFAAFSFVLACTACADKSSSSENDTGENTEAAADEQRTTENETVSENTNEDEEAENVLIAYFSRVGNTDFPEDIDAVSSASLMISDDSLVGNTQYIAELIRQNTGGELFLIETEEKYPADYDETDEQGYRENRDRVRPELKSHVTDMDAYDTIYLGFPNWYYDMPMAVYSFLEEYDLSGKTIIPFNTSGGGGFAESISSIEELQPGANVITDGFTVSHSGTADVTADDIGEWISSLGLD